MLIKTGMGKPGLALAVLTIIVSLSGLAQAQQSGLLPLHPIRRQRVPCPHEDPVYKLYRSEYFGYHPTVWRRFPEGWGFPSPEAANPKVEFEKIPVKPVQPPPTEGEEEAAPAMPGQPEGGRPAVPSPPPEQERSPFEMDRPEGGQGAGAAPGGSAPARHPAAPPQNNRPPEQESPFETLQPSREAPRENTPAVPRTNAPDLAPPAEEGTPSRPPQTSRNESDGEARPAAEADPGPLLALPNANLPPVEEPSNPDEPARANQDQPVANSAANLKSDTDPAASGSQARPKRRRLLSLFNGLSWNWRTR
jgi:hypothetical protein